MAYAWGKCKDICLLVVPGAGKPDPRTGHIVVGLQTQEAVGLIQYSCSARVIPVPTTYLNARRRAPTPAASSFMQ